MKLKLLEDLGNDKAGDVVDRDDEKARKLIAAGIAKELAEVDDEDDNEDEEKAVKSLAKHIDSRFKQQELQIDSVVEKAINKQMAKMKESGFGLAEAKSNKEHDFKSAGDFGFTVLKSALNDAEAKGRLASYHKKAAYINTTDEAALFPADFSKTVWEPARDWFSITDKLTTWYTEHQTYEATVLDDKTRANGSIGGVRAYWTAEGNAPTESKLVPATKTMKLNKLAVLARYSDESKLTPYNVGTLLDGLMLDSLRYNLDASALFGTGGGTQPIGMLTSGNSALVTVNRATASKVTLPDITNMFARAYVPQGLKDYVILFHPSCLPSLWAMKFPNDSGSTPAMMTDSGFAANMQAPYFTRIGGVPAYMCDHMQSVGVKADIALINPKAFFALRKINEQSGIEESIHLYFDKFINTFRYKTYFDAGPARTAPVTPFNGTDTLSEAIVLSTST